MIQTKLMTAFLAATMLTACGTPNEASFRITTKARTAGVSPTTVQVPARHRGTGAIAMAFKLPARAYQVLATSRDIARLVVTLEKGGASVATAEVTRSQMTDGAANVRFSDLKAGAYTVVITAFGGSGEVLGTSNNPVSVSDGKVTRVASKVRLTGGLRPTPTSGGGIELEVTFEDGVDAPAPSTGTTIDQVIADMSAESEAMVIDPRFDWQYKPAITMYSPKGSLIPKWWTGNRPEWSHNVLTWFTAYEAQGNAATNTRVQIKDLRFFVLSESTRTWKRFDFKAAPGVDLWKYPFAPAGGGSGARQESTGGISIKPKYPNFHHGYGNGVRIEPQDVRAVFVAMDFRLAVDDPSKPDDRARAKYVVDAGGDYWPGNGQGDWSLGYAPGMGNSRMLLATPDWRSSTLLVPNFDHGATFEELRKNPPPLQ